MFNLESSISQWREQMLAGGIQSPVPLEELESHLREEIERQIQSGANHQPAFETAVARIGQDKPLKVEFKKIDAENWNRPLAWVAWGLFAISFFLPAYADGPGLCCAGISEAVFEHVLQHKGFVNWEDFLLALQTPANLLMIASPFLLARFSQNARILRWLRFSNFAALALVWSFVLLLITHGGEKDLEIGCYLWAASFLFLCLSTVTIRSHKTFAAKYV